MDTPIKTVGVIGLGQMGSGMALSLQRAGFGVLGHDADEVAREALAGQGLPVADSLAAVARVADVLVLSLPTAAIVRDVVLGQDGILQSARPGALVIDTSTSHPATTRELAEALSGAGIRMIDAPVSGGPKGARTATMTMVLGGSAADVADAAPVLEAMSAKRVHVGDIGAGHVAKIANNLLCAAHLLIAGEVLRMAEAAQVPPEQLLAGVNAGSGRSFVTEHNLPVWALNGAFDSGFTMKLMRKDVGLSRALIEGAGLDLPMARKVAELWAGSAALIDDAEDFNRIVELSARAERVGSQLDRLTESQ